MKQLVQQTVQQALNSKSDSKSEQILELMEQTRAQEQKNIVLMEVIEEQKVQLKTQELTGKALITNALEK